VCNARLLGLGFWHREFEFLDLFVEAFDLAHRQYSNSTLNSVGYRAIASNRCYSVAVAPPSLPFDMASVECLACDTLS
jgi:hypothetical protein